VQVCGLTSKSEIFDILLGKHFAIFDILYKTKSEIFDIFIEKHFAVFDKSRIFATLK